MTTRKKLSSSKASGKYLTVKSKELPVETARKITAASRIANKNISHNNQIYATSNSHASYYVTE